MQSTWARRKCLRVTDGVGDALALRPSAATVNDELAELHDEYESIRTGQR